MSSTMKKVEEHLSRARFAHGKGQSLRSMVYTAEALKMVCFGKVEQFDAVKFAGLLTDMVQKINALEEAKPFLPKPLAYTKGKEKEFLRALVPVIKAVKEERDKESREEMRKRKLAIDKALIEGRRKLEKDDTAGALTSFRKAAKMHVDEDALFNMSAEMLIKKSHCKESLEFLKRGLEIAGQEVKACALAETAFAKLGQKDEIEAFYRKAMKLHPKNNELPARLAAALHEDRVLESAGKASKTIAQASSAQKQSTAA